MISTNGRIVTLNTATIWARVGRTSMTARLRSWPVPIVRSGPLLSAARRWAADPVRSSPIGGSIPIGKRLHGGWTFAGFAIVFG